MSHPACTAGQQPRSQPRHLTYRLACRRTCLHTCAGHYKEVECFRQSYEPLLVDYQVDLVMSGHVHAYERTKPVVEYKVCVTGFRV